MDQGKKKMTEETGISPTHARNKSFFIAPKHMAPLDVANSINSRRSKYTNSSKLTHSQLFSSISRSNLFSKQEQQNRERETQIEIISNGLDGLKNSQKEFLHRFSNFLGAQADSAQNLAASLSPS